LLAKVAKAVVRLVSEVALPAAIVARVVSHSVRAPVVVKIAVPAVILMVAALATGRRVRVAVHKVMLAAGPRAVAAVVRKAVVATGPRVAAAVGHKVVVVAGLRAAAAHKVAVVDGLRAAVARKVVAVVGHRVAVIARAIVEQHLRPSLSQPFITLECVDDSHLSQQPLLQIARHACPT